MSKLSQSDEPNTQDSFVQSDNTHLSNSKQLIKDTNRIQQLTSKIQEEVLTLSPRTLTNLNTSTSSLIRQSPRKATLKVNSKKGKVCISRASGHLRKMTCLSIGYKGSATNDGLNVQQQFLEELVSSAEKDGIIILILMSKKETGQPKKTTLFLIIMWNKAQAGAK